MGRFEDLTGRRFGRLTVLERGPNYISKGGYPRTQWLCMCDCGTTKLIAAQSLKKGLTQSCGCYAKEAIAAVGKENKKPNRFELVGDMVIGITNQNEQFFFDREDFPIVSQYSWYKTNKGYIAAHDGKGMILLHRLVMNAKSDEEIDHVNHQKENACKGNLRIATRSQNAANIQRRENNTSGVTGVNFNYKNRNWMASIKINGKKVHLGCFGSFDEAVAVRKAAEEKYFGEYSYDNSMAASPVIVAA